MSDETPLLTSAPRAAEDDPDKPAIPTEDAAQEDEPRRDGNRNLLSILLAIGLLIAFAAIGWVWKQGQSQLTTQLAALRGDVSGQVSANDDIAREARAAVRAASSQSEGAMAALQQRLSQAEARIVETQAKQAAVDEIYDLVSRTREDRALIEVEQAIGMATQHLELGGNVDAALVALRGAQSRLAKSDAAPLIMLRKALARDIEKLAVAPRLDVSGTALRIEALLSIVDDIPLAVLAEIPAPKGESVEAGDGGVADRARVAGLKLWTEVKSMLRVERLEKAAPELLSPGQEVFLRENLRLRLLAARLSLLSRDGSSFATDLEMAAKWLERYFDNQNEHVGKTVAELRELAKLDLSADRIPTINATTSVLQTLQRGGASVASASDAAAAMPASPPPAPAAAPVSSAAQAPAESEKVTADAAAEPVGDAAPAPVAASSTAQAPAEGETVTEDAAAEPAGDGAPAPAAAH